MSLTINSNQNNAENTKNVDKCKKSGHILFANFISILPFYLVLVIIIYYPLQLMNQVYPLFTLKFIVGYFASIITAEFLKHKLYHLSPIMKRPKGACGCDYLSKQGDVSGNPGFPSGHMSTISFFVFYNINYILNSKYTPPNKNMQILANIMLLLSTGWARWIKKCHSVSQIIAGTFLGGFVALVFIKI